MVLRLLAKDREQRPRDAAEVAGLLDAIRLVAPGVERVTVIERVEPIQRVPTEVEAVAQVKAIPAGKTQGAGGRSRRLPAWAWAVAGVVLLAVAFFAGRRFVPDRTGPVAPGTEVQQEPVQSTPETHVEPKRTKPKTAPAPTPQAPLNVESVGVWTDPATGLMWPKRDNGSDVDWQQAQSYCRNLRLAGHSDWRLARLDELKGLYDPDISFAGHCCSGESVVWHVKGNLQLSGGTWSSLGEANGAAWLYSLVLGQQAEYRQGDSFNLRALCVRYSGG